MNAVVIAATFSLVSFATTHANPVLSQQDGATSIARVVLNDSTLRVVKEAIGVHGRVLVLSAEEYLDGGSIEILMVDTSGDTVSLWLDGRPNDLSRAPGSKGSAGSSVHEPRLLSYRYVHGVARGNSDSYQDCPIRSIQEDAWLLILGDVIARAQRGEEVRAPHNTSRSESSRTSIGRAKGLATSLEVKDVLYFALEIRDKIEWQRAMLGHGNTK